MTKHSRCLDDIRQEFLLLLSDRQEWIPVDSRLPTMFENVIVMGTLIADKHHYPRIMEARRWTGYSGPNSGHDEIGGKWDWLTPGDRGVRDVTHWIPMPLMSGDRPK